MSEQQYIFQSKEIFLPDPDNPESTILQIPKELIEQNKWKTGDTIKVSIGDKGTIKLERVEKTVDNK